MSQQSSDDRYNQTQGETAQTLGDAMHKTVAEVHGIWCTINDAHAGPCIIDSRSDKVTVPSSDKCIYFQTPFSEAAFGESLVSIRCRLKTPTMTVVHVHPCPGAKTVPTNWHREREGTDNGVRK